MYAIEYGLKHFHHYIYGRKVTVTTDHRPLETILSKPLHQEPTQLQRMMIQTLPYDLEVIYSPGSDIPVTDALSRLHLPDTDFQMQRDIEAYVHSVMKTLPVSDSQLRKIRQLTEHDKQLSTLQSVIQHGWPSTRKKCSFEASAFWNIRSELVEVDEIVFKGQRIIIPQTRNSYPATRSTPRH